MKSVIQVSFFLSPAPESAVVGERKKLVAAVAAGSAASPPSPGPEPSPKDVDEACYGAERRRRRRLPLSGGRWT